MEGISSAVDTAFLRFIVVCKCMYNAKVAYVSLVMYCGTWFYMREISLLRVHLSFVLYGFAFNLSILCSSMEIVWGLV